jgi:hypothetical protein
MIFFSFVRQMGKAKEISRDIFLRSNFQFMVRYQHLKEITIFCFVLSCSLVDVHFSGLSLPHFQDTLLPRAWRWYANPKRPSARPVVSY